MFGWLIISIILSAGSTSKASFADKIDQLIFQTANPEKLPSSQQLFAQASEQILWSILIPTITKRAERFKRLFQKLFKQIIDAHYEQIIEIIFYPDDCQVSVGYKRNQLMASARGKYISFIDDDDDIHHNYIGLICDQLKTDPDCVRLVGLMKTVEHKAVLRIHSLYHPHFVNSPSLQLRPITHLNPIRRTIAIKFKFPEVNFGEDKAWCTMLHHSGLLKTEAYVNEPYYFYYFNPAKSCTWPGPKN